MAGQPRHGHGCVAGSGVAGLPAVTPVAQNSGVPHAACTEAQASTTKIFSEWGVSDPDPFLRQEQRHRSTQGLSEHHSVPARATASDCDAASGNTRGNTGRKQINDQGTAFSPFHEITRGREGLDY